PLGNGDRPLFRLKWGLSLNSGDTEDFLEARHAGERLVQAVLVHGEHAFLARGAAELGALGAAKDEPAQAIAHGHELEHGRAAAVARAGAHFAACRLPERLRRGAGEPVEAGPGP